MLLLNDNNSDAILENRIHWNIYRINFFITSVIRKFQEIPLDLFPLFIYLFIYCILLYKMFVWALFENMSW